MKIIFSLGSNLHPREAHIRRAVALLEARVGRLVALSNFKETEPVGFVSPHLFLNGAAVFDTQLPVEEVLTATQQIERCLGREEKSHGSVYADRTIDIDLILAFDAEGHPLKVNTPTLRIPHPEMATRRFVLEPLVEISPYAKNPINNLTAEQMLAALNRPAIRAVTATDTTDATLLNGINTLLPQLSRNSSALTSAHLRSLIENPGTTLFAAFDETRTLSGLATLCLCLSPTGLKAWIEDVVVAPAARRRGYGAALIRATIEKARAEGAKSINLTSRPERISANKLYRALGFRERTTNVYRMEFEENKG